MSQSLPRWLAETEKQDDEDLGMKHWHEKRKHFTEDLDLMLEAISEFQWQPLKTEKTSQVSELMLSTPRSSCYTAQHASFWETN